MFKTGHAVSLSCDVGECDGRFALLSSYPKFVDIAESCFRVLSKLLVAESELVILLAQCWLLTDVELKQCHSPAEVAIFGQSLRTKYWRRSV